VRPTLKHALIACALALGACDSGNPDDIRVVWNGDPQLTVQPLTPRDLPAFFDCLRERDAVMVSAHRGGPSPGFAENALSTFEHTLALAPVFLEVDVSRTRDGALVLMHDDNVDRTTTGQGALAAMTLESLQQLRLTDEDGAVLDEHPPSLRQALHWAEDRAVLELDIKRGVSYEDVVREVGEAGAMGRVVFISYSVGGAARIARIAPEAMIYTTLESARDLDELARRGADLSRIVAWLGTEAVDRRLLDALNARGVEARIGRFERAADFAASAEAGVEGVAANDAAGAVRALDAADAAQGYAALQCAAENQDHGEAR
jgi:glycerophosphoryl diester phosphodiesterase